MALTGVLLRLLLAITLVLNGVGGALAETRMDAGSLSADVPAQAESGAHPEAQPDCHEPAATPDAGENCCDTGSCGCACAALPQLAGTELLLVSLAIEHAPGADAGYRERPGPALPHLIRPPIA